MTPGTTGGRLSEAQKDAVARMVVQGRPTALIAMAVGRTPQAIHKMVRGSLAPRVEEVRSQVMRETATHWFEMLAMLPQCRANMQAGLVSTDEPTRIAMSKWIHEAVVPKPTVREEHDVNVNLGEGASQLLEAMNDKLGEIAQANRNRTPLSRVRSGSEALPRAVVVTPNPSNGGGDGGEGA